MRYWHAKPVPPMRKEALFGDRLFDCFVERPQSVYAIWQSAVERYPAQEAVTFADQRWTYARAHQEVVALANGLAGEGIGRGDRVALVMGNHPQFIFSLMALQRIGAIAVPIGGREQRPGIAYMLNQCEAKGILFDADLAERIPDRSDAPSLRLRAVQGECDAGMCMAALRQRGMASRTMDVVPVEAEDTAIILYTSGTTGSPKGAMLTHLNIAHSVRHLEFSLGLGHEDRMALCLPISHVSGLVTLLLTTLHVGATCAIAPAFKADAFLAFMEREAATYTLLVPAMYSLCLLSPELATRKLGAWRIGGYGGAPMPVSAIEALALALPNLGLVNAYGATETAAPTSVSPVVSDIAHASSIGAPLPCVDVRVMNDDGIEVPCGEEGELWIGGPMTVPGYWNNPAANRDSFTAGYWHSGDIGRMDAEGFLYIVDRKKDMLSRGGYKIYSLEVENRLMAYPGVIEAAIVGKPCPVLGERVHAFIHAPDIAIDEAALRRHCAETLTDYKVPESWTWSAQPLPRNANGKILKRSLRDGLLKPL